MTGPVIRLAALALLAACALPATAQTTFTTMGRLFTTPADRMRLDQQRNAADLRGPSQTGENAPAQAIPPGMQPPAAVGAPPPAAPKPVRLGGMVRRSDGSATVWVDSVPHETRMPAAPAGKGITVDIEGRSVLLKPGQSYDPANGTVVDAR